MSNFISIVSKAYTTNLIDEAAEAWNSATTISEKWREPASEVDLAKIVGFAAKLFGTISLAFLALSTFSILQKRTASLGRLLYTASSFFIAADLLQAGNNLRFEYTMTAKEKGAQRKAEKQGKEWFSGTRAMIGHAATRVKQLGKNAVDVFVIEDPNAIEEFRAVRVFEVAVKDTYVFGPFFRAAVGA